jgi:hypothetical protein
VNIINQNGESQSSAMITIVPTMSIVDKCMNMTSNGHPPEFLQLFTDRKSSIGSNVQFEARVIGTNPLNVMLTYLFTLVFL